MKITVWGIKQAILGSTLLNVLYFKTKDERDAYFETIDHADKIHAIEVNEEDLRPALKDEWDEDSAIEGAYTIHDESDE